jgi:thioredoxin-like negative regulator of GroEL
LSIGESKRALPYLKSAVDEWPSSSEARSMYAIALMQMDDLEQAEVLLEQSCQLNEANPDARAKLAEVYLKTSRQELIMP